MLRLWALQLSDVQLLLHRLSMVLMTGGSSKDWKTIKTCSVFPHRQASKQTAGKEKQISAQLVVRVFCFLCKWVQGSLGTALGRSGVLSMSKACRIQLALTHISLSEDKADNEQPFNFFLFYLDLFFLCICLEKCTLSHSSTPPSPSAERRTGGVIMVLV